MNLEDNLFQSLRPDQIRQAATFFASLVNANRLAQLEKVLEQRTNFVTVVLEDIYQSQNASAAVRTCECMGIQQVHIVEETSQYETNLRVLRGSAKWVELHRYKDKSRNNLIWCWEELKSRGYRICVADPDPRGIPVHELELNQPTALLFGNEHRGVSDYAREHADTHIFIPMTGFTESLNISASVAIVLNVCMQKLRNSTCEWRLTPSEYERIRLQWLMQCVSRPELLLREFISTNP